MRCSSLFVAGEARRRPEDHPLLPPPRFDVGARVMCCVEEDEEIWLTGTVIEHWAQQEGMVCPYVVQVDEDRGEIWVHEDSESAIRALETCHIVKEAAAGFLVEGAPRGHRDGVARDPDHGVRFRGFEGGQTSRGDGRARVS